MRLDQAVGDFAHVSLCCDLDSVFASFPPCGGGSGVMYFCFCSHFMVAGCRFVCLVYPFCVDSVLATWLLSTWLYCASGTAMSCLTIYTCLWFWFFAWVRWG